MNKKIITKISLFLVFVFAVSLWTPGVFATTSTFFVTKGQQKLENKINTEEAQLAELKVKVDPSFGINHTLRKSSRGNDVKLLQKFLKVYGVYPEGLITGYFGSLTEAAVKRFQKKEVINAVGMVGPKTRSRILKISHKKSEEQADKEISTTAEIADAILSASIAQNGAALAPLTRFASTTENIYAVVLLRNAKQDSPIGYIRSYHGSYVDSEVSHPSRNGLAYFHFQWSLKPGKTRTTGDYSLQFYINGKKAKIINYVIY